MSAPKLEIAGSRNFAAWLREQRASLAFTTYQTGKLFLIGLRPDGKLSIFERTFERCMGLAVADATERGTRNSERGRERPQSGNASAQTLWMSSIYQLWRFENALPDGQHAPEGYDRLYVPQLAYTTGDVDAHDIALSASSSSSSSIRPREEDEEDEDEEDHTRRRASSPLFVNTLFSCLAAPSETHSFRVVWRPPFISRLAAEDRCHLNGLAMENGAAHY